MRGAAHRGISEIRRSGTVAAHAEAMVIRQPIGKFGAAVTQDFSVLTAILPKSVPHDTKKKKGQRLFLAAPRFLLRSTAVIFLTLCCVSATFHAAVCATHNFYYVVKRFQQYVYIQFLNVVSIA